MSDDEVVVSYGPPRSLLIGEKVSSSLNEGDLKNLLQINGLSPASSSFPCIFYWMTKDDFATSKLMKQKKIE